MVCLCPRSSQPFHKTPHEAALCRGDKTQPEYFSDMQTDSAFLFFSQLPSDEEKEESYLKNVREAMMVGSSLANKEIGRASLRVGT